MRVTIKKHDPTSFKRSQGSNYAAASLLMPSQVCKERSIRSRVLVGAIVSFADSSTYPDDSSVGDHNPPPRELGRDAIAIIMDSPADAV
jgi:hypothetical protein